VISELFPLSIFPADSLASSVIPVVWVGMFVVCFFNLRLGWVLSGLIVPGYVVPLIFIKPWSAVVILIESILTYFLVWLFSEVLSRRAPWSNFFGRERFFALILCSIVVRLVFDGWLLPTLGEWINQSLQVNFDYRNHLHSFGLIIVALIANQFWKTGLVRGLIPLSVNIIVTALIVRYGLMELTNFSLSNIGYLYEEMATSILATPKAYIILTTTAFLASRMNLKYGWDFNGILIPSLLALQWYQPVKILATIVEAVLILMIAEGLLRTPWLKKITIEGARKLLLFFNVSFVYKILLGYALIIWFPELKVTDYFGFGYLISTLMAIKIHDNAILVRLMRATLQTSVASVLLATCFGFGLTQLPVSDFFIKASPQSNHFAPVSIQHSHADLSALLKQEEIRLYQAKLNNRFNQPLVQELQTFSRAIRLLLAYRNDSDQVKLEQAVNALGQINYQLDIVQERYLYLHEQSPLVGWGVYVIDLFNPSSLALSVPAPLDEQGVMDAGVTLFQMLNAGSLAIAGSSRQSKADLSADVLHNQQTLFHQFHRLMNRHDSLQVRAYNKRLARQIAGSRRDHNEFELSGLSTILWVKRELPPSLDLTKLKQLINSFRIDWTQPSLENQQRELSKHGFAELILTKQAMRALMVKPLLIQQQVNHIEEDLRLDGYLQEWILNNKQQIASKGSELYQKPALEELLFMDEQVLTPIIKLVSKDTEEREWSEVNQHDLEMIARAADARGYDLIHYKERQTGRQYLILAEANHKSRRYWGTYVFRIGPADNYLIQVPRPLYEVNSFEFGVALFQKINAKLLMVATAHPYANLDGSSDVIVPSNQRHLFNLVHQVTLREHPATDLLVVSCRAFSYREDQPVSEADVLFADARGMLEMQQIDDLSRRLLDTLQRDNLVTQWVDGSEQTSGYEVGGMSQARYLKATENKHLVILWLSPLARAGYRQQDNNVWQNAHFNALNIETLHLSLLDYVQENSFINELAVDNHLQSLVFEYIDNPDVMRLQKIVMSARKQRNQVRRLLDTGSKQSFLLVCNEQGQITAIANLLPQGYATQRLYKRRDINKQVIQFIDQRRAWLQVARADESL